MIIRNNPLESFNNIYNLLDLGLHSKMPDTIKSSHWSPSVDVKETHDKFIFAFDLPGVDPNDLEILMENNILTLKGYREDTTLEDKKSYHRIERMKGTFHRRFTLPETVDAEQVVANSKHGVLAVIIGKKKPEAARRISVATFS